MKTAISIPDDLFREVNEIARKNNYSRSQVFCIAVKEYLDKFRAQEMLDALNKAYTEEPSSEEKLHLKKSVEYYTKNILEKDDDDQSG